MISLSESCYSMYNPIDSLSELLKKDPENVKALRHLGHIGLSSFNDTLAEKCAMKLLEIAKTDDPHAEAETYGLNLLAQVNIMRGKGAEAHKYLLNARRLAEVRRDSLSLSTIFNGLAIYTYSEIGDLPGAITYYLKGMDAAKAIGDENFYYLLSNNLANAYLELKDKNGLKYTQECYNYAENTNNHWLIFVSTLCQADYYHTFSDDTRALLYINRAEEKLPFLKNVNLGELYNLKGKIYTSINAFDKAALNFNLAKVETHNKLERYLNVLNSEAEFEIKRKNYDKAEILLDSILLLSDESKNNHARIPALLNFSNLKKIQGDTKGAYEYLSKYSALKDSTTIYSTALMMADAAERYKFDELTSKLSQQKVETFKHQRNFYVVLSLLIIFLILLATILSWSRKQKRINLAIVNQIKGAQKREDILKEKIQILEGKKRQNESETVNRTLQKIIEDIEVLMKETKLYRDPNLTRDSLAEALGTNSTYLSKAISDNFRLNFNQFINSYRLKEAQDILSDVEDDTPIKNIGRMVGFNSSTSFYNNFKEATGMTPAAFREAARQ